MRFAGGGIGHRRWKFTGDSDNSEDDPLQNLEDDGNGDIADPSEGGRTAPDHARRRKTKPPPSVEMSARNKDGPTTRG